MDGKFECIISIRTQVNLLSFLDQKMSTFVVTHHTTSCMPGQFTPNKPLLLILELVWILGLSCYTLSLPVSLIPVIDHGKG